ncbi:group II intron reverse transcriptase/maturase [Photorhabdus africana]|uniref:group II intron reverse transcriptase/maturase n=1 Tax=Photorhabdus africana TaxID=3097554 RepID=UPI002B41834C|nr:group II intron reverse transcriptase/maturase [Photorhabdus sp. CRI-LC]
MDASHRDIVSLQWSEWHSIEWRSVTTRVRRLQVRIAKAAKECNWRQVRQLQRLLTRSTSAKALAIKRVTENRGHKTPGIDGALWGSPMIKRLALNNLSLKGYRAMPLRRIHIPKSNGGKRPLGIPTMKDRAMQALFLLALEPISETSGDVNSYGFRPHRSTQDAMMQCCNALARSHSPQWILEGDIKGCFDNISHEWLLKNVPLERNILKQWLKAGFVELRKLFPTEAGTPQGGIISPVLANLALDGMEGMLKAHFPRRRKVNFVRYADDFIVTATDPETLEIAKRLIRDFLAERGLELSEQKTKITHISDGFDFLGWTFRKFKNKWQMIPSQKNQKRFYARIREVVMAHRGSSQESLIIELIPILKGWGMYHKHVGATRTFAKLDHKIWQLLWRWAKRRHPNKGRRWLKSRYWRKIGKRDWVFSIGELQLFQLSRIRCTKYVKIRSEANPYDPAFEEYFEGRIQKWMMEHAKAKINRIWRAQQGKCPICHEPITPKTKWDIHHKVWKSLGGGEEENNLILLHGNCHRQVHVRGCTQWPPVWLKNQI